MKIEDITAQLIAQVADLQGRVEGAAELAVLIKGGRAPNRTPVAYVLPLGLTAGPVEDVTGLHQQSTIESFGIVLVLSVANDLKGKKALPKIHVLRNAVIQALTGWAPDGSFDVLSLTRAQLKSMNAGTITYQVDFKTTDQLRIPT